MAEDWEKRRDYTGFELGVPALRQVGHARLSKSRPGLGAHVHDGCFEICYLNKGRMHWWAGDEEQDYIVEPGELTLTYPDEPHGGVDSIHEAGDLYWLSVDLRALDFAAQGACSDSLAQTLHNLPRHFLGHVSVPKYFEQILGAVEAAGPYAALRIHSALLQILMVLIDCGQAAMHAEPHLDPRLELVLKKIRQEPQAFAGIEPLAKIAGLSNNRFNNQFKSYTGYSPMDYVSREKVRRAKALLANDQLTITDIALELDFSTTQYFATLFKKYTGMTPSQFRKESIA